MKKVVILNGPPSCGKDDGALHLIDELGGVKREFKDQLFRLTKLIWNIDDETWDYLYQREFKEQPTPLLGGMSPRQSLIHTSETVIKPNYGKTYFGVCAARTLSDGVNFFSDGGFVEELQPIIDEIGEENILVIRIFRPDHSFSSDSRQYLPDGTVKHMVDIHNDSTLEMYFTKITNVVEEWLEMN